MCLTFSDENSVWESDAVADLRGGAGDAPPPPPGGKNFFIFMQFSAKIYKIMGWRPPLGVGATPRGNPGSATVMGMLYCV